MVFCDAAFYPNAGNVRLNDETLEIVKCRLFVRAERIPPFDRQGASSAVGDFGSVAKRIATKRRQAAAQRGVFAYVAKMMRDVKPSALSKRHRRSVCFICRVGFEPTMELPPCRFSRPVHSTALPPVQV